MPTITGMGEPLNVPEFNFFTDKDAATRLRDRVAREIANVVSGKIINYCHLETLLPIYRWLNDIAKEGE